MAMTETQKGWTIMNVHEQEKQSLGEEHKQGSPCWGPEQWAECCSDVSNAGCACSSSKEWPDAMTSCFSYCRYFLLFPVILGIILLALGYYLSPEVIRAMWLVGAGMAVGMGLLAALVMRRFAIGGCCGAGPDQKSTVNGDETNAPPTE